MSDHRFSPTIQCLVEIGGDYKPGDYPAPDGYLNWHQWAEVQHKAGLQQVTCERCGKWKFPQEIDSVTKRTVIAYASVSDAKRNRNPVEQTLVISICKQCENAK